VKGNTQAEPVVVEQVLGILKDPEDGSLIAAWLTPRAYIKTVRDFIFLILGTLLRFAVYPD